MTADGAPKGNGEDQPFIFLSRNMLQMFAPPPFRAKPLLSKRVMGGTFSCYADRPSTGAPHSPIASELTGASYE